MALCTRDPEFWLLLFGYGSKVLCVNMGIRPRWTVADDMRRRILSIKKNCVPLLLTSMHPKLFFTEVSLRISLLIHVRKTVCRNYVNKKTTQNLQQKFVTPEIDMTSVRQKSIVACLSSWFSQQNLALFRSQISLVPFLF